MSLSICAPNIDVSDHYTCFQKKELLSIIKTYNKYINKHSLCNKIACIPKFEKNVQNNKIKIKDGMSKKELWYSIYNVLKPLCNYESCWIDLKFINNIPDKKLKQKIKYFTFKPKFYNGNIDRDYWLNTIDIDKVMKQYEKKYFDFYYLGTMPSDFYKYIPVNFKKILSSPLVGIIFNLDTFYDTGSHWTSLYIDNKKYEMFYFDSFGKEPNKYIYKFISLYNKNFNNKNIKLNGKNSNITMNDNNPYKFKLYINTKQHQTGNSECGVYSIYFLINKLKNTFSNNKQISDQNMKDFRKCIYDLSI